MTAAKKVQAPARTAEKLVKNLQKAARKELRP